MVLVWDAIQTKDARTPDEVADQELIQLAYRILSIIANSASCERVFSRFGITHTKHRNCLDVQSTHDISFVKMDIDLRNHEVGAQPRRLKRHFGASTSFSSSESTPTAANSGAQQSNSSASDDTDYTERTIEHIAGGDDTGDDWDSVASDTAGQRPEDSQDEFPANWAREYKRIPLKELFVYPASSAGSHSPSPLEFYWQGGIQNIDAEMQLHDAAAQS